MLDMFFESNDSSLSNSIQIAYNNIQTCRYLKVNNVSNTFPIENRVRIKKKCNHLLETIYLV